MLDIIPPNKYEYHPLCLIFPEMQISEMNELLSDMQKYGLRRPLTLFQDKILDGRNRYIACNRLGILPRFTYFEGTEEEALDFVVAENIARRHLEVDIRILIAAEISNIRFGMNRFTISENSVSIEKAASLMKVSGRSVRSAKRILSKGPLELITAVRNREVPIKVAERLLKAPEEVQKRIATSAEPRKEASAYLNTFEEDELITQTELKKKLAYHWTRDEISYMWGIADEETQRWFITEILGFDL